MRTIGTAFGALAALPIALGTGCAPRTNRALERAQAAYQQAARDPDIAQNAPVALHEADQDLDRARQAWKEDRDEKETNSLAYVAERRVEIARATAERKKAEDEAQTLNQDRERILLEARTGEAKSARAHARQLEDELRQLRVRETERGTVITLDDALFEPGSAELKPEAARELQRVVAVLKREPDRQAVIEAHTDDTGSPESNRRLSQARADAVRDELVSDGISPGRIVARGLGESYPVASNSTEYGRQRNRRVEIIIQPSGATAGTGKAPRQDEPSSGY